MMKISLRWQRQLKTSWWQLDPNDNLQFHFMMTTSPDANFTTCMLSPHTYFFLLPSILLITTPLLLWFDSRLIRSPLLTWTGMTWKSQYIFQYVLANCRKLLIWETHILRRFVAASMTKTQASSDDKKFSLWTQIVTKILEFYETWLKALQTFTPINGILQKSFFNPFIISIINLYTP